jgi:hypothetical protein
MSPRRRRIVASGICLCLPRFGTALDALAGADAAIQGDASGW